jgi:hypothetical protein
MSLVVASPGVAPRQPALRACECGQSLVPQLDALLRAAAARRNIVDLTERRNEPLRVAATMLDMYVPVVVVVVMMLL